MREKSSAQAGDLSLSIPESNRNGASRLGPFLWGIGTCLVAAGLAAVGCSSDGNAPSTPANMGGTTTHAAPSETGGQPANMSGTGGDAGSSSSQPSMTQDAALDSGTTMAGFGGDSGSGSSQPSMPEAGPDSGASTSTMIDGGAVSQSDAAPDQPDAAPDGGPGPNCEEVVWDNLHKVPNPKVEAVPDDAGKGAIFDQSEGLDSHDYTMEEFFFSGTSPSSYTTRMVVKKPKDPAKFSGTVFVEWYNVSGGIDVAVIWANSSDYFMREGHVFIGVSAQKVGADELKQVDSERYAPINHPGDGNAADIFSQAGVAIRMQTATLLGPCMPVRAVIAAGQSQSASQMSSYLNNTHPKAEVYDGYDIHSGPEPASNDPGVPTLQIFTMSEGNGSLGDGPNLVEWEIAGSTHNDAHIVETAKAVAPLAGIDASAIVACVNPLNEFPAYRVYNAAIDHLIRWVRNGERPPAGLPFEKSGGSLALDEHGNVKGGIRIQDIDVPIATYDENNGPSDITNFVAWLACGLGGETVSFTPAELMKLYPTHDDYVMKYTKAADEAVAAGYELQADRDLAVQQAQMAPIPK